MDLRVDLRFEVHPGLDEIVEDPLGFLGGQGLGFRDAEEERCDQPGVDIVASGGPNQREGDAFEGCDLFCVLWCWVDGCIVQEGCDGSGSGLTFR